jgi:hypothetical protein
MKEWGKVRSKLSSGMNNGNARSDITVENIVNVLCEFIVNKNLFGKNILRKEIDYLIKDKFDVSPRIIVNRVKNHSSLIELVNKRLTVENLDKVIYDPYYRSDEQKKTLSKEASGYNWVTDGISNKQVKKIELDKYLTENTTYRKGRTI